MRNLHLHPVISFLFSSSSAGSKAQIMDKDSDLGLLGISEVLRYKVTSWFWLHSSWHHSCGTNPEKKWMPALCISGFVGLGVSKFDGKFKQSQFTKPLDVWYTQFPYWTYVKMELSA